MKSWMSLLILTAFLLPAAAGARALAEREEIERYQANYKALKGLIAEASKLQSDYLEGGDLAAFEEAGAAWQARSVKFLHRKLAPFYAEEFARVKYRGPDVPAGQGPKARAAYQRIEARKVLLRAYTTELRKPD